MILLQIILTLFTLLLWILGGLMAFMLVASCTPIHVMGRVDGLQIDEDSGLVPDRLAYRARASWLLGIVAVEASQQVGRELSLILWLIGVPIRLTAGRSKRGRKKGARSGGHGEAEQTGQSVKGKRVRKRRRFSISDLRQLLPEIRWLIVKLWRTVRVTAEGDLIYGFEDPSLTGWSEALRPHLGLPSQLRLVPDYTKGRLEGWARIQLTSYPIRTGIVLVAAAFRRGVRRLWWPPRRRRVAKVQ